MLTLKIIQDSACAAEAEKKHLERHVDQQARLVFQKQKVGSNRASVIALYVTSTCRSIVPLDTTAQEKHKSYSF